MFDIGWSEMMVVGAVALVVIGPKDLPGALRQAGKWMGAVRRMASDFQGQLNDAMREAELDELRREMQAMKSGFNSMADPVRTAGREMRRLVEMPSAVAAAAPAVDAEMPEPQAGSVTTEQVLSLVDAAPPSTPVRKPRAKAAAKTPAASPGRSRTRKTT